MLYSKVSGEGPDIVFLHGWGLNAEVWHDVVNRLRDRYRITILDLPGHGRSANTHLDYQLDTLANTVVEQVPDNSVLVGWSMGGLIAQRIALLYPEKVNKLVLIACNAQFIQSEDWPHAMKAGVLNMFVENLQTDYQSTLQRFLMLQAKGGENNRNTIRELKQRLYAHGEPDTEALQGGLQLLKTTRFVEQLSALTMPVLTMFGRLDALVPHKVSIDMVTRIRVSQCHVFQKSAHAPFISHLDEFLDVLNSFLDEHE